MCETRRITGSDKEQEQENVPSEFLPHIQPREEQSGSFV